jgi:hypothetical protein
MHQALLQLASGGNDIFGGFFGLLDSTEDLGNGTLLGEGGNSNRDWMDMVSIQGRDADTGNVSSKIEMAEQEVHEFGIIPVKIFYP